MKATLKQLRAQIAQSKKAHAAAHVSHQGFHLTYLGAAYLHGHGVYAFAAGGLFLVILAAIIFGWALSE